MLRWRSVASAATQPPRRLHETREAYNNIHESGMQASLSAAQQTRTMNATVIIKELYTSLSHAMKMLRRPHLPIFL